MKNEIIKICKKNNGYITNKDAKNNNIPTIYLSRMIKSNELKRVAKGIYLLNGFIEDEFYILYLLYPNIIFDKDTALYLNKLTNNMLHNYSVVLPYNCNVPINSMLKIKRSRKTNINLGKELIETPYGNKCMCYDKERCICDLFLNDDFDYEDKAYAINEYKNNYLNKDKLYSYAKQLGIFQEVFNLFEVIAWI